MTITGWYALVIAENQTKEDATLKIQFNSDEEKAVDIIYEETEMTVSEAKARGVKGLSKRDSQDKVKVKYPKVVFVADDKIYYEEDEPDTKLIKFYDKSGKVKKEFPVQTVIPGKQWGADIRLSKNRKFIAVTNVKKSEKGEVQDSETIILDTEGDIKWEVDHTFSSVWVSPNGKYIVGSKTEWGGAPLWVFYENGSAKEIQKENGTGAFSVTASKDGSFFVLLFETINTNMRGVENHIEKYLGNIIAIDDEGNVLWKKNGVIQGVEALYSQISISDTDVISLTIYKPEERVLCFDKKGNTIKEGREQ